MVFVVRKPLKAKFRSRAILLLSKGKTVDETVNFLKNRYHPEYPLKEVRRAYFPRRGIYAISVLEGENRKNVLRRMAMISEAKKVAGARFSRIVPLLFKDPIFARRHSIRSAKTMRRNNSNPVFVAARMEALRLHNLDPDFIKTRNAASVKTLKRVNTAPEYLDSRRKRWKSIGVRMRKFWEDYRSKKAVALRKPTGWEITTRVPISEAEFEDIEHHLLRRDVMLALKTLTPLQQAVVSDNYDLGFEHDQDLSQVSDAQRVRLLNEGLTVLRKHPKLKAWFETK